jgi:branched-chain amino acid transport system substrate-binding protein
VRRRALAGLIAVAASLAAAGCGGGSKAPLVIGVLAECTGPFASFYEPSLAAAELPLLARGARLQGTTPQAGIEGAVVGGHRLSLVFGCTQQTAASTIAEARRLVEQNGARILVGGLVAPEAVALRAYAAVRPDVTFLVTAPSVDSITLHRPSPNLFRFAPSPAQLVAGLGSYAYQRLGWRRAVVLGEATAFDYGEAAGFVAEFCSLGGSIERRVWLRRGADAGAAALAGLRAGSTDGAAVFAVTRGLDLVHAFAPHGALRRRIVTDVVLAGQLLPAFGNRAQGVAWAWPNATDPTTAAWHSYNESAQRWFPHEQFMSFLFPVVYFISMEAIARALDLQVPLRVALGRADFVSPLGRVRLDRNRQLIATTEVAAIDLAVGARRVRAVSGVEESFGGHLGSDRAAVGPQAPACVRGSPPGWTR